MKNRILVGIVIIAGAGMLLATTNKNISSEYKIIPSERNGINTSDGAFNKMMDVLTHQRCMNCHPNDNIPKQGEDSHSHYFGIKRGKDNVAFQAIKCTTCHQSENNNYSGVPGAPDWALAPASMYWEGLSRIEIAKSMMDSKRNGGRTPEETFHHLTEHELVLWAWEPGIDAKGNPRELPPVSKEDYIAAVTEWFENGHRIPSK
jgi:ribosomal protein L27